MVRVENHQLGSLASFGTPDVSLVFNDRAVDELLANEPLAKNLVQDRSGHALEIAASIAESRTALDAGVRPRGSQSVVEQLMMELSLATATQSSHSLCPVLPCALPASQSVQVVELAFAAYRRCLPRGLSSRRPKSLSTLS